MRTVFHLSLIAKFPFWRILSAFLPFLGVLRADRIATSQTNEYVVEKWTAADGLPSSSVMGLARTEDGFLWVGTDNGLARFDGEQFSVFTQKNLSGLRSNTVQNMAAGPDSQVYVGTWAGGFTVLNHGHARSFGKAEGIKSNMVGVVLPVGVDEAWFGTDTGYLYHYLHGAVAEIGSDGLPRSPIFALAKAADGTLWIGSQSGLFSLSQGKVSRYQPKIPLPGDGVFDLAITDTGRIFMCNDRGLFEIQGDHWRSWTMKSGLPSDRVGLLTAAPGDILWIATNMGIAQLAQGRIRPIKTPFCDATAIVLDAEKSIWVGCSEGKGLLRLRQPAVGLQSLPGNVNAIGTRSLAQDQAGTVWAATAHGLIRLLKDRSMLYTTRNGLPNTNLWAVSAAPDGSVWVASENGFANMKGGKIKSFRTQDPGPDDPILSVIQDRSGTLWVGANRGLLRRRAGQTRLEEVPHVVSAIWSLREDTQGNIWAATKSHGLFCLRGESQVQFTTDCGLASNMVYDTLQIGNGDVWIATEGGVTRIRNGKCASIRSANGLPPGRILAISFDSQGHLWLEAPTVLIAIDIADANRVADSGGFLASARILGEEDGFGQDSEFGANFNSIIRHSSGRIWFATYAGIGTINPAALQKADPVLKPQVDSFVSDVGDHDLTRPLVLSPGDVHLRFAYSVPSLFGAKTREYRYRLDGVDDHWRDGGKQRDAVYTSLQQGKYTFQVSVRRPFEPWSDTSTPIEVQILGHFYQTWWWYTVLTLALFAAVLLGYRLRLVTVRRQYAALMTERLRERSRLARELHDTLAQGMSGIHIQIEAAQVLLDADPKSIRRHLENVELIAREAALDTRRAIAALRADSCEMPTLRDSLEDVISNFSRMSPTRLTATVSDDLPELENDVCHEINRLVEEALSNVRLHANANHAYLTARTWERNLLVEVRDDGKGFNTNALSSEAINHFGITGMKERARRVNGNFQLTSTVGEGTRVALEVPLSVGTSNAVIWRILSGLEALHRFVRWRRPDPS